MDVFGQLAFELLDVIKTIIFAIPYLAAYVLLILLALFVWQLVSRGITPKKDFGSLKTVTFGDASSVASNSVASVVSIVAIVLLWGAFTGSKLVPSFIHMPGAFEGELTFTYEGKTKMGLLIVRRFWSVTTGEKYINPRSLVVKVGLKMTFFLYKFSAASCWFGIRTIK